MQVKGFGLAAKVECLNLLWSFLKNLKIPFLERVDLEGKVRPRLLLV